MQAAHAGVDCLQPAAERSLAVRSREAAADHNAAQVQGRHEVREEAALQTQRAPPGASRGSSVGRDGRDDRGGGDS